jgi:hypothetical protein
MLRPRFSLSTLLLVVTAVAFTFAQPLHVYHYDKRFIGDFVVCGPDKIVPLGDGWALIGSKHLNPYLPLPALVLVVGLTFKRLRRGFHAETSS